MNSTAVQGLYHWGALVVLSCSVAAMAWLVLDVGWSTWTRYRTRFTENAHTHAQAFFWFIDPQRLLFLYLAAMGSAVSVTWLVAGQVWVVAAVWLLVLGVPRWGYRWLRWRRQQAFEAQLPDALLLLAGALRAGAGLQVALQAMVQQTPAPLGQEFGLLLREQRLGLALDASLAHLQRRMPTANTVLVVSALRIAGQTGGSLAEVLERVSHTVRAKLQMEGKVQALTAQGKLQAWVVGLLPLVLMVVLQRMEPDAMALLWHTRIGWATLALVAMLELLGIYTIRRIVAIDV